MGIRRDVSVTIWRTVVAAGAMLGTACAHQAPATGTTPEGDVTPETAPPAVDPDPAEPAMADVARTQVAMAGDGKAPAKAGSGSGAGSAGGSGSGSGSGSGAGSGSGSGAGAGSGSGSAAGSGSGVGSGTVLGTVHTGGKGPATTAKRPRPRKPRGPSKPTGRGFVLS